jgi:hypothetical protein
MAPDTLAPTTWGFQTSREHKDVAWKYAYAISIFACATIGAFTAMNGCVAER